MSRIKALILDAGGVLVHPYHGSWNIPMKYRELLGVHARDIGGEAWNKAAAAEAHRIREDIVVPSMQEEYIMRLDFLRAVDARMGWQLSDKTLLALAEDFTYNLDRHAWYTDSIAWLEKWQGKYRLGILSDASPSFLEVVTQSPAKQLVEEVVTSTRVGAVKPSSKMYNEICMRMNIDPADCLFVDDRICNLEGAIACGMRAVQMCRDGYEHTPWDGDKVHDLSELNAYVEGLN